MEPQLKTIIVRLAIEKGVSQRDTPNMEALRGHPVSEDGLSPLDPGDLYLLAADAERSPDSSAMEHAVIQIARDAYYDHRAGIVARLRKAVQEANHFVLRRNQADGKRRKIGLVLLVTHGAEAFGAQVGPAACFTVSGSQVARYPEYSPWFEAGYDKEEPIGNALGADPLVDPAVFHHHMKAGDLMLLADQAFVHAVSDEGLRRSTDGKTMRAIVENLVQIAGIADTRAMLIQVQEEKAGAGRPPKAPAPAGGRKETKEEWVDEEAEEESPEISEPEEEETEPRPYPRMSHERAGVSTARGIGLAFAGIFVGLFAAVKAALGRQNKTPLPAAPYGRTSRPVVKATFWQKNGRYAVIILPLAILLIIGLVYLYRDLTQRSEYNRLVSQVQSLLAQTDGADANTTRSLLSDAEMLLTQAQKLKPDAAETLDLRQSIAERLDKINKVERLYSLPLLHSYTDPATIMRRVVANGQDIYTLDVGNSRVYHHRLDSTGEKILMDEPGTLLTQKGAQVTNKVVSNLIDIGWASARGGRQTSSLLILAGDGLLEYSASWGLKTAPIASAESWGSPVAMATYLGNLYLLDIQANKLFKYIIAGDGYNAKPDSYFPSTLKIDLSGAVDVAIASDIFLLYSNGRIAKFSSGAPVPFQTVGLDKPLSNPSALFTGDDAEVKSLYVVDTGNKRIVQLTKDGKFVRQFMPAEGDDTSFDSLRSIFVDEVGGKLYILNANDLYIANLP